MEMTIAPATVAAAVLLWDIRSAFSIITYSRLKRADMHDNERLSIA